MYNLSRSEVMKCTVIEFTSVFCKPLMVKMTKKHLKGSWVSRDVIASIESDASNRMAVGKIDGVTGIDYCWLTTGEGEMLHVSDNALEDHRGSSEGTKRQKPFQSLCRV